jgi:hypothetical protein
MNGDSMRRLRRATLSCSWHTTTIQPLLELYVFSQSHMQKNKERSEKKGQFLPVGVQQHLKTDS